MEHDAATVRTTKTLPQATSTELRTYLELTAKRVEASAKISEYQCRDDSDNPIGKAALVLAIRDGKVQGRDVQLQTAGDQLQLDIHIQTVLLHIRGKKYIIDSGNEHANKTVFFLHYKGKTAKTNHFNMLQRKTLGGYTVVFNKREPVQP